MSSWDDIEISATGTGGGSDWPLIPDDVYDGKIINVGEPYDKVNMQGQPVQGFVVEWELTGGDLEEPVTMPNFLTLPYKLLTERFFSPKAKAHILMTALGFDMSEEALASGETVVRPPEWVGKRCRVVTKIEVKDGKETSWINGYMPKRQKSEAKAPVAAGARAPLASRVQPDEDED